MNVPRVSLQHRGEVMRIATITPTVGGQFKVKIYEAGHDAESSSASRGTLPRVIRVIGSHHFGGTPRWRHFSMALSRTPSSRAASLTRFQSIDCVMSAAYTDKSSAMQRQFGCVPLKTNCLHSGVAKDQNWKDENYLRIKDLMRKDIADQKWSQPEAAMKVLGIKDPRQAKQRIEKWLKPRDSDGKVREVPLDVMQMWSDYFDYDWEEFSLGRQSKERRRTKQAGGQS